MRRRERSKSIYIDRGDSERKKEPEPEPKKLTSYINRTIHTINETEEFSSDDDTTEAVHTIAIGLTEGSDH